MMYEETWRNLSLFCFYGYKEIGGNYEFRHIIYVHKRPKHESWT